jgi:hypothetical protein
VFDTHELGKSRLDHARPLMFPRRVRSARDFRSL